MDRLLCLAMKVIRLHSPQNYPPAQWKHWNRVLASLMDWDSQGPTCRYHLRRLKARNGSQRTGTGLRCCDRSSFVSLLQPCGRRARVIDKRVAERPSTSQIPQSAPRSLFNISADRGPLAVYLASAVSSLNSSNRRSASSSVGSEGTAMK